MEEDVVVIVIVGDYDGKRLVKLRIPPESSENQKDKEVHFHVKTNRQ